MDWKKYWSPHSQESKKYLYAKSNQWTWECSKWLLRSYCELKLHLFLTQNKDLSFFIDIVSKKKFGIKALRGKPHPTNLHFSPLCQSQKRMWMVTIPCCSEKYVCLFLFCWTLNFARYSSYHLHNMNSLPNRALDRFMMGEHVVRHKDGYWNSKWSFMYMETTFIHHGKGPVGIVRVTLKPEVVKEWANSFHICT